MLAWAQSSLYSQFGMQPHVCIKDSTYRILDLLSILQHIQKYLYEWEKSRINI